MPADPTLTAGTPAQPHNPRQVWRVVIAAAFGNALEWFDFVSYGYFAIILAKLFFPSADSSWSLLLTMATFASAYIVRPIGSILLGIYADRFGAKRGLTLTIWLMVAGTAMIGFAPTAATAGNLGAAVLIVARILQGFAASGEFGSAVTLLAKIAPVERRNFYISWQMSSTTLAIVLAGLIGLAITEVLTPAQLESWGWRIPFLIGLLLAPVGLYLRRSIDDDPVLSDHGERQRVAEIVRVLTSQHRKVLLVIGLGILSSVGFNLMLIYIPAFAVGQLGLPSGAPYVSTIIAGLLAGIVAPVGGLLADRRPPGWQVVAICQAIVLVIVIPLFVWLVQHPTPTRLIIVQIALAVPFGMMSGIIPAIMANAFPPHCRATGVGLSYNLTSTLFGGLPLVAVTALINVTGDRVVPAYWLAACALISLLSLILMRHREYRPTSDLKEFL